jgi:hypothetical protein
MADPMAVSNCGYNHGRVDGAIWPFERYEAGERGLGLPDDALVGA